ncbi:hypothetical protein HYFRA_00010491 [Hymenoscyphus fraxineus]|uniref:Uncharacterized protein n=1 Tax=Hymenoscyphus fraxineus TaxID=746836 RepID=A0A9N9L1Z8_9HELO|nr:hypothetical protein HYFRA_00010491 [Hymenoscyphus fraxineus]
MSSEGEGKGKNIPRIHLIVIRMGSPSLALDQLALSSELEEFKNETAVGTGAAVEAKCPEERGQQNEKEERGLIKLRHPTSKAVHPKRHTKIKSLGLADSVISLIKTRNPTSKAVDPERDARSKAWDWLAIAAGRNGWKSGMSRFRVGCASGLLLIAVMAVIRITGCRGEARGVARLTALTLSNRYNTEGEKGKRGPPGSNIRLLEWQSSKSRNTAWQKISGIQTKCLARYLRRPVYQSPKSLENLTPTTLRERTSVNNSLVLGLNACAISYQSFWCSEVLKYTTRETDTIQNHDRHSAHEPKRYEHSGSVAPQRKIRLSSCLSNPPTTAPLRTYKESLVYIMLQPETREGARSARDENKGQERLDIRQVVMGLPDSEQGSADALLLNSKKQKGYPRLAGEFQKSPT